ncbi:DUF3349 domain-containing protein [Tsukamurella sp. 8F]|uniref:DUF3349 domain-containing protein n=1 Tax=unclassified Tsukamurella TaxID=2633480 RepID=UPI0023B950A6|nr:MULTISPECIES: DUF3349 domain-containing protein [unclassified Tsukamurella]MDF0531646.1 DUF3349 domain-containing protein [Tsukamurella sp. 8J]MDF0588786.1 DUF3349 domain-containing protein [Tsukamurella sp. 8F]
MARGQGFVTRIVDWLRAGYPDGVPHTDYQPLLALLERQLTQDEVKAVTRRLIENATVTPEGIEPISRVDAGTEIAQRTHQLPSENDVRRVRERLERKGWPFDDEPLRRTGSDPDDPHTDGPYGGA